MRESVEREGQRETSERAASRGTGLGQRVCALHLFCVYFLFNQLADSVSLKKWKAGWVVAKCLGLSPFSFGFFFFVVFFLVFYLVFSYRLSDPFFFCSFFNDCRCGNLLP